MAKIVPKENLSLDSGGERCQPANVFIQMNVFTRRNKDVTTVHVFPIALVEHGKASFVDLPEA